MAIYQGGRGMAFQGGGGGSSSMFDQMNRAIQRTQEIKQSQREQKFLNNLNENASMMGKISDDFYDTIGNDAKGHIQVGGSKNWKEHYDDLSGQGKKARYMKRVFGRQATPEHIQNWFKGKTKERDTEVVNAITRKMQEMGTSDVWKVVPKLGETGGKEFKDWYDNASDETREHLRTKLKYVPGQAEARFTPDWIEKRMAQGKGGYGSVAPYAVPGSYLAYKGGEMASPYVKRALGASTNTVEGRQLMKKELVNMPETKAARSKIERRIKRYKAQASASHNAEVSKLKQRYKDLIKADPNATQTAKHKSLRLRIDKLEKAGVSGGNTKAAKNLRRYEKYLKNLDDTGRIPYRMGGGVQIKKAKGNVRQQLIDASKKGKVAGAKRFLRGGVGAVGGGLLGGAVEKAITGEDTGIGRTVGTFAPQGVKAALKSKAGKSLIKTVGKRMAGTLLASQAIDAGVPTYVDIGAGILGLGLGLHDYFTED